MPEQPSREDVEALLETRRELGPGYDDALLESFVDRVEQAVAHRARPAAPTPPVPVDRSAGPRQLALAIISMVACIPISITLGINDKLVPLLVTLAAIVAINAAHALQSRPRG